MRVLIQVKRRLDGLVDMAVRTLLSLLALTVFVAVIARYLFNFPLAWSEEVSRYSFIWLSFLGAEVCLRERAHLGVDLLVKPLPRGARHLVEIGGRLLMGVMIVVLLIAGIKITPPTYDQQSPALGIPMSFIYLAVPVGAALMLLELVYQTLGLRGVPANSDR